MHTSTGTHSAIDKPREETSWVGIDSPRCEAYGAEDVHSVLRSNAKRAAEVNIGCSKYSFPSLKTTSFQCKHHDVCQDHLAMPPLETQRRKQQGLEAHGLLPRGI